MSRETEEGHVISSEHQLYANHCEDEQAEEARSVETTTLDGQKLRVTDFLMSVWQTVLSTEEETQAAVFLVES